MWNNIPDDIKLATALDSLKRKLKSFFFWRSHYVFGGDNFRSYLIICPKCERVNIKNAWSSQMFYLIIYFKFYRDGGVNQAEREMGGCLKGSSRCDLCKNFLIQDSKFKSFSTGRTSKINQNLSCSSKNIVYLASCIKCNLQHV